MSTKCLIVLLLTALCPARPCRAAAAAAPQEFDKLQALFTYDAAQPLDLKERAVRRQGSLEQHDISYASPKGGRVSAFLLVPSGKTGPFAGIVLMHGATGSRRTLLAGARLLCEAGAVCLLIDAPNCGDRHEMGKELVDITRPDRMREGIIQLVLDLRRGIDLLAARPDVDPKRLAFIGSSVGGSVGGILAGVEKRVAAYAFLAAAGNWQDAVFKTDNPMVHMILLAMSKEDVKKALATLAPLDPMHYIGHAAPASLLFQMGRKDGTTPPDCAQAFIDAGSRPKSAKWYEAGHTLSIEAFLDRAAWLHEKIGLGAVNEPKALTGLNH